MVERAVSEFGRLDAAFNNAGTMAKVVPRRRALARVGIGLSGSICAESGAA